MKKTHLYALTAALALGAAVPALAAWDRIGSVEFDRTRDYERQYNTFGGRVESLSFRATKNAVQCTRVTATFANGRTRDIFSGRINEGRTANVDLAGTQRNLRNIDFLCRSLGRGTARLDISAEIGQYRGEWQSSPDWGRTWSRILSWGKQVITLPANNWTRLGSERFEGRRDSESTYAGVRGRSIDAIALKASDADATCSRVAARFGNGNTRDLTLRGGRMLRRGAFVQFDVPGGERNLRSLTLTCHAEGARAVTIEIYAQK